MADKTTQAVDYNKSDGKPVVEFSSEFLSSFDKSISAYDDAIDSLHALISGKGFDDEYGICNCSYDMRYITPNDISTYINDLFKAISMKLIKCDIADLEKFSVEMAKRFIAANTGKDVTPDNIFAMSKYFDPRNATLMDLLVQTENTFFDRCVYSKFEMKERATKIKPDYDKIAKLHFAPTMKAVVKAIPGIIKKAMTENNAGFVCCNCDTVMTYIETFILFAVGLNTCMVTQMIGYCEPMTTYLRKDTKNVVQESVSLRKNKPVYVVLVSGTNVVSATIKKFTHSKWSHAAISFDPSLEELYSYTFATTEYAKASQGLRRESIKQLNNLGGEICVYGFYSGNRNVKDMVKAVHERIESGKTKYDLGLLVKKAFNDNAEQSEDPNKKICSAFVNSIISEFVGKISDKVSPSPDDMSKALDAMSPNEFVKLYEGSTQMYDQAVVTSKLKRFAKDAESKPFTEYVSEFCLVKTNDINIRARIPFDFNMRNIVLQDCTPNFKDTKSALHYMLKDTRSPIHAMVIQHATDKRIPNSIECNSTLQMFEPYFHPKCMNGLAFDYDRTGFLTDVNWLDKIAYGNNFLDGNYRMDALGNENRHPIYTTLQMLHRMFCGCALKTNEDIANNILKIAGVMLAIINEQPWACCNKELVKDILVTLGECFTRNVIKLYNNHCTIVTYSDNMNDTMIPGYTYCEAFVFTEAETPATSTGGTSTPAGAKPAPAAVHFDPNTAPKNSGLNRLTTMLRQFAEWITKKLGNIPALFEKINGAKITYVAKHNDLNQKISQALAEGTFKPTLQNFPRYSIPLQQITSKADAIYKELDEYVRDPKKEVNAAEIKAKIYPGNDATARAIANLNDPKKEAEAIQNFVLFSVQPNQAPTFVNGVMSHNMWDDMCNDIMNAKRLIDTTVKPMVNALTSSMKTIEKIQKKEEADAQKQQQGDNTNNQQPQQNKAQSLFDVFRNIVSIYQINVINAFTNAFFNTYYRAYKDIVTNFQMQSKNQPQSNLKEKADAVNKQPTQGTENSGMTPVEKPNV